MVEGIEELVDVSGGCLVVVVAAEGVVVVVRFV